MNNICTANQEIFGHSDTSDALYSSFPAVQEPKQLTKQRLLKAKQPRHHQQRLSKSSELKFKIESLGIHPVDDADLEMCPSRIRPAWPKKIIPWWVATDPNDKPPFSYATIIAHAIFSSKDGRITLNDIYVWISREYPSFRIGAGGWQNSIRHNLSLNKKWFYKIDRQPTQTNPGKGCYWTLVVGTEHIFIDNLTHESNHSRRYHDIGFTAELSMGMESKPDCQYNNAPSSSQSSPHIVKTSKTSKQDMVKPSSSHLYTTFRTVKRESKLKRRLSQNSDMLDDSDNDSGVDVSNKFIDKKEPRKRRCTTNSKTSLSTASPTQTLQDSSIMYAASTFEINPSLVINNWVEDSLLNSENQMCHNNYQLERSPVSTNNDIWCDSIVAATQPTTYTKTEPITIDLENEEFTHKYLPYDFTTNFLYPKTFIPFVSINANYAPLSYVPTAYNNYQLYPFVSMQDILYF